MNSTINPALLNTIKRYQPRLAILFGSAARGDADPTSDVDIVLVKNTKDNFFDRLKKFALMLPPNAPRVDALIYTPEEFAKMKDWGTPLIQQAIKEGKIIYEVPD
jgi:predicted nucleotidyltransferase